MSTPPVRKSKKPASAQNWSIRWPLVSWPGTASIRRPLLFQSSALPTELPGRVRHQKGAISAPLAGTTGFEPATSGLTGRRELQASPRPRTIPHDTAIPYGNPEDPVGASIIGRPRFTFRRESPSTPGRAGRPEVDDKMPGQRMTGQLSTRIRAPSSDEEVGQWQGTPRFHKRRRLNRQS